MIREISKKIVSVIIPVYNVEPFLEECLKSVCSQTYTALDIICVNDGSTDNSLNILNTYEQIDSRIRVITKDNGGLSSARNYGLRVCKGDYIIFVDSDDMLVNNAIEIMIETIESTKSDILVFGAELFPKENIKNNDLISLLSPANNSYQGNEITERMMFDVDCCNIYVWNKMYRRDVISGVFFDENILFGEDRCFLFDVFPNSNIVTIIENKLYRYRQNVTTSLTESFKDKQLERTKWKIRIIEHTVHNWMENEKITVCAKRRLILWVTEYIERAIIGLDLYEKKEIKDNLVLITNKFACDLQ